MELVLEVKNYLDDMGKVKVFPSKKKKKILVLQYLATKFEKGVKYTEKEVNNILDNFHTFNDRCLLRRELYNNRFLGRLDDCTSYWLEDKQPTLADFKLD